MARVRNAVLLTAAAAWALLIAESRGGTAFAHCSVIDPGAPSSPPSLNMLLAMNPPASVVSGWMLMLAAMMLPVLTQPIYHVYVRSFAQRRLRSIAFFLAGYLAIWIAAGTVLLSIELAGSLIAPQSWLPVIATFLIAVIWQISPLKQRCLNRCHAHADLAAFGAAADLAVLRFGATHGIWCACSCWAWMLFPMLLPRGHIIAMAAVAILLFCERLEQPKPPSWGARGLGKAARILIAQTSIRLPSNGPSLVSPITKCTPACPPILAGARTAIHFMGSRPPDAETVLQQQQSLTDSQTR
jgi:predicted metal-binding membrane protein